MRALRFRRCAREVGGEAVDLVAVLVAQLDSHRVDAVDSEARASGFVALAQRHRDDDVSALVAGRSPIGREMVASDEPSSPSSEAWKSERDRSRW